LFDTLVAYVAHVGFVVKVGVVGQLVVYVTAGTVVPYAMVADDAVIVIGAFVTVNVADAAAEARWFTSPG